MFLTTDDDLIRAPLVHGAEFSERDLGPNAAPGDIRLPSSIRPPPRRVKETGIRMALGARPAQVLCLVMREGTVMISAGAAFGFAGAYGISRALPAASAPMAEIISWSTGNRALTAGIPLLLVSLAAIACYLPARRSIPWPPCGRIRSVRGPRQAYSDVSMDIRSR